MSGKELYAECADRNGSSENAFIRRLSEGELRELLTYSQENNIFAPFGNPTAHKCAKELSRRGLGEMNALLGLS